MRLGVLLLIAVVLAIANGEIYAQDSQEFDGRDDFSADVGAERSPPRKPFFRKLGWFSKRPVDLSEQADMDFDAEENVEFDAIRATDTDVDSDYDADANSDVSASYDADTYDPDTYDADTYDPDTIAASESTDDVCAGPTCQSPAVSYFKPECCAPPFWEHTDYLSGDFLYLSAHGVDTRYATHVDGTSATAVPLAPINTISPNYQPGFRIGVGHALDQVTSVVANFWYYNSGTSDAIDLLAAGGTGFLRPELVHPNTLTVASDRLTATANYDIDYQIAEAAYKALIWGGDCHAVNFFAGARYATLDQDLQVNYINLDTINVNTEIDFHGIGPQIGLSGERVVGERGWMLYSKGMATFLVGQYTADFKQRNVTTSVTQAVAGFKDNRVVPQLELELGVGWRNCCGNFEVRAGYFVGAWFNGVTTPDFIDAVQQGNYNNVSGTMTFDGLTAHAEFRF